MELAGDNFKFMASICLRRWERFLAARFVTGFKANGDQFQVFCAPFVVFDTTRITMGSVAIGSPGHSMPVRE